jgi:methylmalonyl-CoA epimerase
MAHLNHIGIAVSSPETLEKLFACLDLKVTHREPVPSQGVNTHFIALPLKSGSLELLEPIDSNGTISQYLSKRGPGIHHLSFELDRGELAPASERLRAAGFRLIYDQPRPGAHEMMVNFVHPATAGGLLIEIMEKAK